MTPNAQSFRLAITIINSFFVKGKQAAKNKNPLNAVQDALEYFLLSKRGKINLENFFKDVEKRVLLRCDAIKLKK